MAIKKDTLHAKGLEISIYTEDFKDEYISLTDIAKTAMPMTHASSSRTGCARAM